MLMQRLCLTMSLQSFRSEKEEIMKLMKREGWQSWWSDSEQEDPRAEGNKGFVLLCSDPKCRLLNWSDQREREIFISSACDWLLSISCSPSRSSPLRFHDHVVGVSFTRNEHTIRGVKSMGDCHPHPDRHHHSLLTSKWRLVNRSWTWWWWSWVSWPALFSRIFIKSIMESFVFITRRGMNSDHHHDLLYEQRDGPEYFSSVWLILTSFSPNEITIRRLWTFLWRLFQNPMVMTDDYNKVHGWG